MKDEKTLKIKEQTHQDLTVLKGFPSFDDLFQTMIEFVKKHNKEWETFKQKKYEVKK